MIIISRRMTSKQRRTNVDATSHRRWSDVDLTSCACWAVPESHALTHMIFIKILYVQDAPNALRRAETYRL